MKEYALKIKALLTRRDRIRFGILLVLMIIGSLLDVVGVGAIPAFVATFSVPGKVMAIPALGGILTVLGIETPRQLVLWGAGSLIVVFLVKNLFLSLIAYVQVRVMVRFRIQLSQRLFSAYMRAPYVFHLKRNSAELLRNVTLETTAIVQGVLSQVLSLLMALMMTTMILLLLVIATPWIAVVTTLIVGSGSWAYLRVFNRRLIKQGKVAQIQKRRSIQAVNQGLGGLIEGRVLRRTKEFEAAFNESVKRFGNAQQLFRFAKATSKPALESIAVMGLLLVVIVLVLTGSELVALVPTLALFGAAIVRLRVTLGKVVNAIAQIRFNLIAIDPVYDDLMDLGALKTLAFKERSQEFDTAEPEIPPFEKEIRFLDVCYTYPSEIRPVLDSISVEIRKGESVGFVGGTGAGKTTLINLLLGLLVPGDGSILVDDRNIQEDLDAWRSLIGYIPQDIFLLDDTIKRNIAFALPEESIDDAEVNRALHSAQLDTFIAQLEDGIDTVVGERGVRLSGGQRQRIGLARALYNDPQIIVMDEATSSLDNHTENEVMKALDEVQGDRTFIMIAHRLSTVQKCDRLYFLNNGRIEAEGSYEELIQKNKGFQMMAHASGMP